MAWERIGYEVLGSAAASISISVPTPYGFYRITAYIANDANAKDVYVRFNADPGANYSYQTIDANSTTIAGARATGQAQVSATITDLAANGEASFVAVVAKPAAGVKGQMVGFAGQNASPSLTLDGAEWNNTAAEITSVALVASSNNFAAGSSFLLEGLSLA